MNSLNNLENKLENNSQINKEIPENYENTPEGLPWPIRDQNSGGVRVAPRGRTPLPNGHFGRVSENIDFRSGPPKIFPKALSHSIFRPDRKYGLGFAIRHREDREKLELPFYPYRIG